MKLRGRINKQIGLGWRAHTSKNKEVIRNEVCSDKEAIISLLDSLRYTTISSYDFRQDKDSLFVWQEVLRVIEAEHPLTLNLPPAHSLENLYFIAKQIVDKFICLAENDISNCFWYKKEPRNEENVKKILYTVVESYRRSNRADFICKLDCGTGYIKLKYTSCSDVEVCINTKLSSNHNLVNAYEKFAEYQSQHEKHCRAMFLLIDIDKMDYRAEMLMASRNTYTRKSKYPPEIEVVDITR